MAKINIDFNNADYSIDESALTNAANDLKSHLSTTMSGTGATINFGGEFYNVDSTKLSAATNNFISHLGTIAGNGKKIVVGGVEYSVDAAKTAGTVTELEDMLGELNNGGEPELGFPITWNTMEVMNNPSFVMYEIPFVKVSDYAPHFDELKNTTYTMPDSDKNGIIYDKLIVFYFNEDISLTAEDLCIAEYSYRDDLSSGNVTVISVGESREYPELDGMFIESGLYTANFGLMGGNMDIVIDLVDSTEA